MKHCFNMVDMFKLAIASVLVLGVWSGPHDESHEKQHGLIFFLDRTYCLLQLLSCG